jgi:predicted TIM-barrel fold metal-dependent hydrolase
MLTKWGELAVADAHVHFFSHRFLSALGGAKGLDAGGVASFLNWTAPAADPVDLARAWVGELDRQGVARAALIASMPGDESSVAAAVAAFPGRFYGFAMFHPLEAGAPERARAAFASGVRVLCLFPAMHGYSVADPRVAPVLETAAEAGGRAVFVHSGVLTVGVRKRLGLPSPFDMRFSNPIDLHPVALRYPGLPFIVPHFGAGYFREALMLADLCPNVYLDTSSSNSWMRYEDLDLATVFRRSLAVAGPRRLLFGTDSSFFPRGWNRQVFEAQAGALESLGVSAEDAAAIVGGNLGRILGSG